MSWKIETTQKKSITEVTIWKKDDLEIRQSIGWRWGYVSVEEDPEIDTDLTDADEVCVSDFSIEDQNFDDGCWEDWEFPDKMSDEDRETFLKIYEEDFYGGLEEAGWMAWDTEIYFRGPLEVTEE
jgi:hypothetical protein